MSENPHIPRFKPALEGVRGVAALGVMTTHIAFQTGLDPRSVGGAIIARFDFFVAVFFTLSAFVLWRQHRYQGYYMRRFARIVPAYWIMVLLAWALLSDSFAMSKSLIIAHLSFTQLYIPQGLIGGLTHLWSLVVEIAFYLLVPPLYCVLKRFPPWGRILVIVALAAISLGWAWLPWVIASPAPGIANRQIYPPAFFLWFALGIIAAELEPRCAGSPLARAWFRARVPCVVGALIIAYIAGQEWVGPLGLTHPSPGEFTVRILLGGVFSIFIIGPYIWAEGRSIYTTAPVTYLGRISYSFFLVHLPVLSVVITMTQTPLFSGHFLTIWGWTFFGSLALAYAGYELVEKPAQRWILGLFSRLKDQPIS
ncbi:MULTISPECIES: acyltransferase [unclassified Corynebacterium]|uniref:acyltransferase family protein n=1 Tax=unclassified Corynebacterium TaxID=2624378 RepID=UPI00216809BE|nr:MULTISPECIES: acyltransferase [unclassified Corynebacterium]MCS4490154.1 acyltransferase [Corynebacterium sp. ES2775-CONJ]MCS4492034.1 acyltransferase [Corynebacterium sp. ES2715-CONJ3]MCS4532139.1 acyltransferase [Corynebacterium sp. ES2730-CONJ]